MTIADSPVTERPRERLFRSGVQSLSLRECLAILFGSGPPGKGCLGLAGELLSRIGSDAPDGDEQAFFSLVRSNHVRSFFEMRGLGPANQARLVVVIELIRRSLVYTENQDSRSCVRPQIGSLVQQAVSKIDPYLRTSAREWIGFVPIFSDARLGSFSLVEQGVRTHVNFDPADLFSKLLVLRPKSFMLFHNHPSGDLSPSEEDRLLTESVGLVAGLLRLGFEGHYIVGAHAVAPIEE